MKIDEQVVSGLKDGIQEIRNSFGSSWVEDLKSKDGRQTVVNRLKALSTWAKAILGFGVGVLLLAVCIFFSGGGSNGRMGENLGKGMPEYFSGWLAHQKVYEDVNGEFQKLIFSGSATGQDVLVVMTKNLIPAAKAVLEYLSSTPVPEKVTEDGKKCIDLCKKIGTLQHEMWVEYRNAAFMGNSALKQQALQKRVQSDALIEELEQLLK